MMNVPPGDGPFPVVILCHGYVPLEQYATGDGTVGVLDLVTAVFFLVLMLRLDLGLTAIVVGCLAFELLALRAINRRSEGISRAKAASITSRRAR